MKKIIFFVLVIVSIQINAQVSINGYLSTDNRFRTQQNGKLSWNENRLNLKFEGTPSYNIHYFSEVRLRAFSSPNINSMTDLQSQSKVYAQPLGLELREIYIDAYGLFDENLDGQIKGRNFAYKPIFVNEGTEIGQICTIKVVDATTHSLIGEIAS